MTKLFPVIAENKLNIYCIYIKNYTLVRGAHVSFIEALLKVNPLRKHFFSVLLVPLENVAKLP